MTGPRTPASGTDAFTAMTIAISFDIAIAIGITTIIATAIEKD
ncbi:hypothetical protein AB0I22_08875 [Streptomyces sp. NPDC050610]